ncbi:SPFH domain-containing protein [Streptomyces xanthophaeus]|uniref:SPFH domain-containing protein n=1 Tax=Streptomyces xanthophaeus TaxID=67385 RepID=UPI0036BA448A
MTEATMYPTRTTSTTGTLHVPPAAPPRPAAATTQPAAEPESFGTPAPARPAAEPESFGTPAPAWPAAEPESFGTPGPDRGAHPPQHFPMPDPALADRAVPASGSFPASGVDRMASTPHAVPTSDPAPVARAVPAPQPSATPGPDRGVPVPGANPAHGPDRAVPAFQPFATPVSDRGVPAPGPDRSVPASGSFPASGPAAAGRAAPEPQSFRTPGADRGMPVPADRMGSVSPLFPGAGSDPVRQAPPAPQDFAARGEAPEPPRAAVASATGEVRVPGWLVGTATAPPAPAGAQTPEARPFAASAAEVAEPLPTRARSEAPAAEPFDATAGNPASTALREVPGPVAAAAARPLGAVAAAPASAALREAPAPLAASAPHAAPAVPGLHEYPASAAPREVPAPAGAESPAARSFAPAGGAQAARAVRGFDGASSAASGAGAVGSGEPQGRVAPVLAAAAAGSRAAVVSVPAAVRLAEAPAAAAVADRPAPEPPHGPEVPAARAQADPDPDPQDVATLHLRSTAAEPAIPHPLSPEPEPEPVHSGIPGPGVAEIVAQAVERGLDPARDDAQDDTQDLPRVTPLRGAAVTEVPVHLPFRAEPAPGPRPRPATAKATATAPTTPRRAQPPAQPPVCRAPRGDERLREHRGPVLPGWIGVAVGGLALAGCAAVLWRTGILPAPLVAAFGGTPRAYQGLRATHWPPLAFLGIVALLALGGLGRARTGHAWVLTLFGRYRGTVRRTGLTWISPLLLRRRVDVRLRHWRSEPMPAVDSGGLALQVVVQVVWQVKDTARATLGVEDHVDYLAEQVESAMARVLSQLPADAFHEDAPTLRDAEAVGEALTRMLAAETEAVGVEVFSAQPTRIEYAPEVAAAMRRRRVAAIDAKHRDSVLTSVVDAVDDTVHRLTSRGLVELDDYERKALVKDLTVAFYTGRSD